LHVETHAVYGMRCAEGLVEGLGFDEGRHKEKIGTQGTKGTCLST
jgi:hypothetical protein